MTSVENVRGSGPRAQKRILIVPGDLVSGELRESFLDRMSFQVRAASGARDAIDIAEIWQPNLVAFRSTMHGMTTAHFCNELRSKCQRTRTKLLMLTDRIGDPLDAVTEVDCDAHLVSPMDMRELLDTMAALTEATQRRSSRVGLEVLVQLEGFVRDGRPVNAEEAIANSINVSEDGLLLECAGQLDVGSEGKALFFLPGSPDRIEVAASVRVALDEIRLHYALEFRDLDGAMRALIRDYVADQGVQS